MRVCAACEAKFQRHGWACPSCGFSPRLIDGIPAMAPELAAGNPGDAAYLHDVLAEAETEHFWFVARGHLILWALQRYFPDARTFCDLGCGSGAMLKTIHERRPELRLTAADALTEGLSRARLRVPAAEFVQLDLQRLPFDAEFDVVGIFDVLEHLDDDVAMLEALRSAIVPGGGFVITVPQHQWLWSAVDEFSHHRRRYSRRELVEKIRRAGFRLEYVTSFMTLLLPVLVMSRLRRHDPAAFDPASELRIGRTSNRLLAALCAIEQRAMRLGCPLPAGGSLLAVARR
jgi:2-polyprenyl-3-methyl-5-hydroxy-6-metoxy-1,4-benzoquinol methylase